jgi:ABC-2 type transport system ATP-binding protein
MSLLEACHLNKRFGTHQAVADVSLALEPGEILGLLGPNGAGKSTTMSMIAGLLSPDAGEVRIDGQPYQGRDRKLKRRLGLVPQELAIYPDLNAIENLRFFGRLYGLSRTELRERCESALHCVGLTDSATRPSGTFSGGMKRRLNFGIALMHRPEILILDEPTVGIDPQSRSHLLDCIRDAAKSGVAVIYASHYMEEVQEICQRVAIIDRGRLLAYDAIPKLLEGLTSNLVIYVEDHGDVQSRLDGMATIETGSDGLAAVSVAGNADNLGERLRSILHHLLVARVKVVRVETQKTDLERLFLNLTGYALRD